MADDTDGSATRGPDILFTGPHRSGTTLVCSLLNALPGAVALHEPLTVPLLTQNRGPALCDAIDEFCTRNRRTLVEDGYAQSGLVDGAFVSNTASSGGSVRKLLDRLPTPLSDRLLGGVGVRTGMARHGKFRVDKAVSEPFTLVLKQPAAFTAALPTLAERFMCIAIVRNPLATLASWNTVDFKRGGRAAIAEKIDPTLGPRLDAIRNRYDRQVDLLSWFFDRYRALPREQVITYEALCDDPAATLTPLVPEAATVSADLANRNRNTIYNGKLVPKLAQRLLASDGAFWDFYDRASVEQLASAFAQG
ncbi:MAG: hypothetical protein JWL83_4156 [Actinomycetia bacterium]|nr:hypothetical protein [Actinomycetes bacterium]